MKIEKYITTPIEAQFDGLTLLSKEEYNENKERINLINNCWWWWLRSPGKYTHDASGVSGDGSIGDRNVNNAYGSIRPALILNPESSNLKIGDKFKFYNHNWTVISTQYALCDEAFYETQFRKNWAAEDANIYEVSDIKKYIDVEWEKMKRGERNEN